MNVSLTPELEKLVQRKVKSGLYSSASEVIREGLRLMQDRDLEKKQNLTALKKEIQIGINQVEKNDVVDFNPEDIKQQGRKKLKQ